MQYTVETLTTRYEALFGYGWKIAAANAFNVHRTALSNLREGTPTFRMLAMMLEWFEITPHNRWPKRWDDLAARRREKQKRDAA